MGTDSSRHFSRKPVAVPRVETKYRRIVTSLPSPGSLPILEELERCEPRSLVAEQLPVVWDRAEGFQVFDKDGNCWIDFSSGIFVTNAGHGHPEIVRAIQEMAARPLLHNYWFSSEIRAKLVRKLVEISPRHLDMVILLSTGAEATECAIKLTRIHGQKINSKKLGIVSLTYGFHGKTMGAQTAGGRPSGKEWIGVLDPNFHQIPVPFRLGCPGESAVAEKSGRDCFEKGMEELRRQGVDLETIAGFILEPYQGWSAAFHPNDFVQAIREWATAHKALLIFDEIQSGFGRTGRLFAHEYFGVEADLVCCGKGISSSVPLSAVLGRRSLIDADASVSSTHGGNPVSCAAALKNLEIIQRDRLVEAAARVGAVLGAELEKIRARHPDFISYVLGRGLLWGIHLVNPETKLLDVRLGDLVTERAMQKGVLLCRTGAGTIKMGPPLCITEDAVIEGARVIGEAIDEIIAQETSKRGIGAGAVHVARK